MRFLPLFLFTILLFSYGNSPVYAQSEKSQSATTASEASTTSTKKENVFSRASDEQIAEAQRFYKKCKGNTTLNARKDCKCAATSYLETRLELGASATVEQIIAENINTCLKDEKSAIEKPDNVKIEVTEAQMKEAESVYNWCNSKKDLRNRMDCECLASKFLEKRIDQGPIVGRDIILGSLGGECKNLVESAGIQYQQCMSGAAVNNTYGIQRKKFCECYARKYTKGMEADTGNDPRMALIYGTEAIGHCKRPESYPQEADAQ